MVLSRSSLGARRILPLVEGGREGSMRRALGTDEDGRKESLELGSCASLDSQDRTGIAEATSQFLRCDEVGNSKIGCMERMLSLLQGPKVKEASARVVKRAIRDVVCKNLREAEDSPTLSASIVAVKGDLLDLRQMQPCYGIVLDALVEFLRRNVAVGLLELEALRAMGRVAELAKQMEPSGHWGERIHQSCLKEARERLSSMNKETRAVARRFLRVVLLENEQASNSTNSNGWLDYLIRGSSRNGEGALDFIDRLIKSENPEEVIEAIETWDVISRSCLSRLFHRASFDSEIKKVSARFSQTISTGFAAENHCARRLACEAWQHVLHVRTRNLDRVSDPARRLRELVVPLAFLLSKVQLQPMDPVCNAINQRWKELVSEVLLVPEPHRLTCWKAVISPFAKKVEEEEFGDDVCSLPLFSFFRQVLSCKSNTEKDSVSVTWEGTRQSRKLFLSESGTEAARIASKVIQSPKSTSAVRDAAANLIVDVVQLYMNEPVNETRSLLGQCMEAFAEAARASNCEPHVKRKLFDALIEVDVSELRSINMPLADSLISSEERQSSLAVAHSLDAEPLSKVSGLLKLVECRLQYIVTVTEKGEEFVSYEDISKMCELITSRPEQVAQALDDLMSFAILVDDAWRNQDVPGASPRRVLTSRIAMRCWARIATAMVSALESVERQTTSLLLENRSLVDRICGLLCMPIRVLVACKPSPTGESMLSPSVSEKPHGEILPNWLSLCSLLCRKASDGVGPTGWAPVVAATRFRAALSPILSSSHGLPCTTVETLAKMGRCIVDGAIDSSATTREEKVAEFTDVMKLISGLLVLLNRARGSEGPSSNKALRTILDGAQSIISSATSFTDFLWLALQAVESAAPLISASATDGDRAIRFFEDVAVQFKIRGRQGLPEDHRDYVEGLMVSLLSKNLEKVTKTVSETWLSALEENSKLKARSKPLQNILTNLNLPVYGSSRPLSPVAGKATRGLANLAILQPSSQGSQTESANSPSDPQRAGSGTRAGGICEVTPTRDTMQTPPKAKGDVILSPPASTNRSNLRKRAPCNSPRRLLHDEDSPLSQSTPKRVKFFDLGIPPTPIRSKVPDPVVKTLFRDTSEQNPRMSDPPSPPRPTSNPPTHDSPDQDMNKKLQEWRIWVDQQLDKPSVSTSRLVHLTNELQTMTQRSFNRLALHLANVHRQANSTLTQCVEREIS